MDTFTFNNHAHIYEHSTEASEFSHEEPTGTHSTQRRDNRDAATLLRRILANDEPAVTAHDCAERTNEEALPDRVRSLLDKRAAATERRRDGYQAWKAARQEHDRSIAEAQQRHINRSRDLSSDYGLEL